MFVLHIVQKQVFVPCSSGSRVVPGGTQRSDLGCVCAGAYCAARTNSGARSTACCYIHSLADLDFDTFADLDFDTFADFDADHATNLDFYAAADLNTAATGPIGDCC